MQAEEFKAFRLVEGTVLSLVLRAQKVYENIQTPLYANRYTLIGLQNRLNFPFCRLTKGNYINSIGFVDFVFFRLYLPQIIKNVKKSTRNLVKKFADLAQPP